LAEYESRIETERGEWVVVVLAVVSNRSRQRYWMPLQSCLHGSEVASVKVRVDGRTYVMESH
jgi:hypothetical protein